MTAVRFCFDFLSPYAYLAWQRIHDVAAAHGARVEPVPVLLAGLLHAHGTKGPAEVPAKRAYVFKDASRTAARLGVPLIPPPAHPFRPLLALRVAGLDMGEDVRRRLISALFDATWAGGPGVEDPAVVGAIAAAAGVSDAVARARAPEAKARLRAATDEAVAAGVFGVPTSRVGDELFWGFDSLDHLDRHLAGADPLPPELLARWAHLPATAGR